MGGGRLSQMSLNLVIPEWLIITIVWETGKKYKLQNFI